MTTLTHSGVDGQFLSATSGASGISYCDDDCVLFSGISDALAFSRSIGSSFIATGTNQQINVAECGAHDSIIDLGRGLSLSFYELDDATLIPAAYLQINNFEQDATGRVHVLTGPGQTATVIADAHGTGSYLTLSGQYGGIVHFANDPVANLTAHLVTS